MDDGRCAGIVDGLSSIVSEFASDGGSLYTVGDRLAKALGDFARVIRHARIGGARLPGGPDGDERALRLLQRALERGLQRQQVLRAVDSIVAGPQRKQAEIDPRGQSLLAA